MTAGPKASVASTWRRVSSADWRSSRLGQITVAFESPSLAPGAEVTGMGIAVGRLGAASGALPCEAKPPAAAVASPGFVAANSGTSGERELEPEGAAAQPVAGDGGSVERLGGVCDAVAEVATGGACATWPTGVAEVTATAPEGATSGGGECSSCFRRAV